MSNSNNDLEEFSNLLQDNFKITVQPKQHFRYRYLKDLKKSSHGVLKDQESKLYPTVRLLLPTNGHLDDHNNKREFHVLCTLHNSNVKCLSPHVLLAKGEKQVDHTFLFHKMLENDKPLERFWELKEYIIVRMGGEFKKALECKRAKYRELKLQMDFEKIKGKLNLDDEKSVKLSGACNVSLGFTIFERDCIDNSFRLYKETIFSNTIYNGDELNIHKLCNLNGSISGGTKVTILIKLEPNLPLTVLIKRINEQTKETEWSKEIKLIKSDIFGNHAITFELPSYEGPSCSDDEILVNIQVVVTGSTYKSNSVKFNYLKNSDYNCQRKKARNSSTVIQEEESVTTSLDSLPAINPNDMHYFPNEIEMASPSSDIQQNFPRLSLENIAATNNFGNENLFINPVNNVSNVNRSLISKDKILSLENKNIEANKNCAILKPEPLGLKVKNKIEKIFQMPEYEENIDIMGLTNKDDNTIFHEALHISNYFIYFYKMANKSPHKKLVCKARNKYRENLIHYSCLYNRSRYIRPLIGMGCRLNEQDIEGRTPLHIAMEFNRKDCILEIQQLLEDHSKYPTEVVDNLIKMFKVYNHRGFTVLHAAVIDNRLELVEIMLKFCRKYNININEYEVLGNGDSLVHLIVEHNLIGMVKFLPGYIPNYLTVKNYAGNTALDIPDTTKEMQQALNV